MPRSSSTYSSKGGSVGRVTVIGGGEACDSVRGVVTPGASLVTGDPPLTRGGRGRAHRPVGAVCTPDSSPRDASGRRATSVARGTRAAPHESRAGGGRRTPGRARVPG